MAGAFTNWTFREVEKFLKSKAFVLNHTNGSHFYYKGVYDGVIHNVCVPFHGQTAIKPRTMKGIVEQSGIPKKEWIA